AVDDAFRFAAEVAAHPEHERFCRAAAGNLYHATTAALLAAEGTRLGTADGDARRLLLSRFVLEHRLNRGSARTLDAMNWENASIDLLLDEAPVSLDRATALMQE
ncbi:MAG: DNA alkylation response protein, partial [Alphaproteobacteria bacterium]|nr:DNA alkylation response protein [Alphaproteobacteria bacterium]